MYGPDTCTSVEFLTIKVREPDTDDWEEVGSSDEVPEEN